MKRRKPTPRALMAFAAVVAALLALGLMATMRGDQVTQEKSNVVEQKAVTLASFAQLAALCNDPEQRSQALAIGIKCEVIADAVKAVKDGEAPPPVVSPGRDGADGIDGAQGPVGPRGPRGLRGLLGDLGAPGVTGPAGPVGQAGKDGATGSKGESGPTGPTGPAGADGNNGSDGTAGAPGQDGAPGADGRDGTALPGSYICQDGEVLHGFTVTGDGSVTLDCRPQLLP